MNFSLKLALFYTLMSTTICFSQSSKSNQKKWKQLEYDKAKIFFYCPPKPYEQIEESGVLNKFVDRRTSRNLSSIEIEEVLKNVIKKKGEKSEPASCFIPHHGIVFYKHNKIVASISFCLMCNVMKTQPSIDNLDYGFEYLEALVKKYKLPNFDQPNKYKADCQRIRSHK